MKRLRRNAPCISQCSNNSFRLRTCVGYLVWPSIKIIMSAVTSSTIAGAIADALTRKRTIVLEVMVCGLGSGRRKFPYARHRTLDRGVHVFSF